MTFPRKSLFGKCFAFSAIVLTGALVAVPCRAADDLSGVLAKMDASAAKFKSAQADVVWDAVQTQPILDSDKQAGTILFARSGGQVQVALHLRSDQGRPMQKDMIYAGGVGKLYDAQVKQMQVFAVGDKKSALDAFLTLGFGGSGADLQKSWTIKYDGAEAVGGVQAAKLELVPKDASVAKATPKVLLWIDLDKGVGLQQQRYDASGNYTMITYSNVKLGVPVPSHAFELKPPSGTQIVNH
jgi:outer membrane lipoprotein-sorting protein